MVAYVRYEWRVLINMGRKRVKNTFGEGEKHLPLQRINFLL